MSGRAFFGKRNTGISDFLGKAEYSFAYRFVFPVFLKTGQME
ncbi:hypothetical protein C900_02859 [Fulvivirga imtechensis AK7]|uniref:Uncharacterized protein n=1 Tax=Fulvivirga imtechensis AK7 TaxID=1237149 RepID=L8JUM8_9BACT|nr:hypothetical protein C900_02859 [Fulvivirga imtechensis AK7]